MALIFLTASAMVILPAVEALLEVEEVQVPEAAAVAAAVLLPLAVAAVLEVAAAHEEVPLEARDLQLPPAVDVAAARVAAAADRGEEDNSFHYRVAETELMFTSMPPANAKDKYLRA